MKEDMKLYPIWHFLGIKEVDLMTNNPKKLKALEAMGVKLINVFHFHRTQISITRNIFQQNKKLGHLI